MERHNGFFTPDEIDEQIEQLIRADQIHPQQESAANDTDTKFIRHLHAFYQEESAGADQRSLERVAALLQQSEGLIFDLDESQAQPRPGSLTASMPENQPARRLRKARTWSRRINMAAAAALLVLLVSSMVLVFNLAHSSKNSTGEKTGAFVYTLKQNNLYKLDLQRRKEVWSTPVMTDGYWPNRITESNGIAYTGTSLSDIKGKVYTEIPYVSAYKAQTGALLWRTGLDPKKVGGVDLGFITQPVVANGRVYVISDAGKVYALDALTGRRLWVYDTHQIVMICTAAFGSQNNNCGAVTAPLITVGSDGTVYVSVINSLFALNGMNGSRLWAVSLNLGHYSNGMAYIDDLVSSGGNLYVTSSEFLYDDLAQRHTNLYVFNAKTGQQRWFISKLTRGFTVPIIAHGAVYIGSVEGTVYAFRSSDGFLLWHKSPGGQILVDLSESNGVIYVQTNTIKSADSPHPASSTLVALNAADGSTRWQRSIDTRNTIPEYQIVTGGVIYLVIFDYQPSQVAKGHFVIDAYSAVDGHKL